MAFILVEPVAPGPTGNFAADEGRCRRRGHRRADVRTSPRRRRTRSRGARAIGDPRRAGGHGALRRARCSTRARSSSRCGHPCSSRRRRVDPRRGRARVVPGFGPEPDGFPRYIGATGMDAIGAALAAGLDVRYGVEVDDVDDVARRCGRGDRPERRLRRDDRDPVRARRAVRGAGARWSAARRRPDPQLRGRQPDEGDLAGAGADRPRATGCDATLDHAAPFIGSAEVVESRMIRWRHGRARTITGPGMRCHRRAAAHGPRRRSVRRDTQPRRGSRVVGARRRGRGAHSVRSFAILVMPSTMSSSLTANERRA